MNDKPMTEAELIAELHRLDFPMGMIGVEPMIEWLGKDFEQLAQTVESGYFAYAKSSLGNGSTIRSHGATPWLALANVCYAKLLEQQPGFAGTPIEQNHESQQA